MQIAFVPSGLGWIRMEVGPDPQNTVQVKLSWIFDSCLRLHTFFFHLATDATGISRADINEEGRFVTFAARPAKNDSHAHIKIDRNDEQLHFTCSRRRAAQAYARAFRELVDDHEHDGFNAENLYLSDFELLLGNF